MTRVNLVDSNRKPIHLGGIAMANVELRMVTGSFLLVRAPGEERDLKGNPVVRDRVVPLERVAAIDYLDERPPAAQGR